MTKERTYKVKITPEVERGAVNIYAMNKRVWNAFVGQVKSRGSNVGEVLETVLRNWLKEQNEIAISVSHTRQETTNAAS